MLDDTDPPTHATSSSRRTRRAQRSPRAPRAPHVGPAWVYLLHFTRPLAHARHYMGATTVGVPERMAAHRSEKGAKGRPARLLRALLASGGDWVIADVWTCQTGAEAFELERALKRRYKGFGRVCSICAPPK